MIRAVIIGAGRIALSHLPHILNHPDIEPVAIVEPSRIVRFMINKLTGVRVVARLDKVDRASFDCAFILTPPQTHFDIGNSLLDDGKHVFLEKPLTLNPDQSERLINIAKDRKVQFSVGYVYRFHPVYNKLKEMLDCGEYGAIRSSEITMLGNVVSQASPKTWRNVGLGSGCLFDYGCHVIDLSLFLFGRPDQVVCIDKQELFQIGVVDKFKAKLEYRGLSHFDSDIFCNWADGHVRKAGIVINIIMDNNSLWTDGQLIKVRGDNTLDYSIKDLNTDVPYYLRGEEFKIQLDCFVTAITNNKINYTNAEDAVFCDRVIFDLHEKKL
jgi:scyllo-inositol 2-dehydrogenase (NADP+)